jgi:hypothetical protein
MRSFLALTLFLSCSYPVYAQTKTPASTGNFTYSATKLTYRSNGVRLDGTSAKPATVKSPQIDASAQAIAFDLEGNSISQIRAQTNVDLKLNFAPKTGGKAARVEVKCTSAVLTTATRVLVLKGNLNGFYQEAGGPRNILKGESATLAYVGENLNVVLEGGAQGVTLVVPAQGFGTGASTDATTGTVTITAKDARIDQGTGVARFIGNARAVSTGGGQGFDVSASEFVITRAADGQLSALQTVGKTAVKLDLPPEPAGTTPNANGIGKPTRVEVTSDKASVNLQTSVAKFDGNVKGFYRLQPAVGAAQNYNFAGEQATIGYDAKAAQTGNGLSVEVTGSVEVQTPSFDF